MDYLNKISLKYKIVAAIGSLILALGCGLFFIIIPSLSEIDRIKDDIYLQRQDLEQKYQRSKSLKKLSNNLKSIEGKIENIDQVFISENRELEFITALEQTAEKMNVSQKINLGKAQAAIGEKYYKKIPLQIQVQGKYIDVVRYLQGLETLNYYINIKSIDLAGGQTSQRSGYSSVPDSSSQVSASIIADSYWR